MWPSHCRQVTGSNMKTNFVLIISKEKFSQHKGKAKQNSLEIWGHW